VAAPWPRSLQGRLLALVLVLVTLVWAVAALKTWRDARHELDELLDGHLAQAAALLVVQQAGRWPRGGDSRRDRKDEDDDEHGRPLPDAPNLHRYAPRVAFQVFHEGRLVTRSAEAPVAPMLPEQAGDGFSTVAIDGERWRVFSARGAEDDVRVIVGESTGSRDDILGAVIGGTLWPLALALPLLGLAVWWAVRQGTEPLRRLGRVLSARRPDALQPVALPGAPSEMQPLVDALNGLFARIDQLLQGERRFTADAAHELRTPIAAIRTQAQVAMGESDDALRRHALASVMAGCDRATRLVEQLLTLARLEAAGAAAKAWPVDLAPVVRRVVGEVACAALARGQEMAFEGSGECRVAADETLAAVLVRNLVDNAVRYAPPGAAVRVSLGREAEHRIRLRVEDGGPGLAEAELARLGERFFRVLGSGATGSGLGWSIVRRIADVQSADVRVGRSATLGGLEVTVTWPAAEVPDKT
jgi:two-component system sensor histidine kinase QseC